MKMKKLMALLLAGALSISLAACGGTESDGDNADEPSGGDTTETDGDTEGESDDGAEEKKLSGSIVYWSMWQETEPSADALKVAIEAFEEAYPDVEVTVEWQGRGVRDLVTAAIGSGEQVDIFDSDPTTFYQGSPDILMDLTDFYESPSLDDASITVKDSILSSLITWDAGLSKDYSDGKNYSLPYNPFCIDFFYNTDHFADAGIEAVPTTWEELDAVCAKLKEAGYEPIVTDDAYAGMMFSYYLEKRVGEETIKEMTAADNWENEGVLDALKAMEDFASKGYFAESIKTNKYPAGQQQFARQEASMYFNASFMASENAETAGENFPYGHFAFPTVPNGSGTLAENSIGGQSFMVNANTENKEAVYELLRYIVSEAGQQAFLDNGLTTNLVGMEWPAELAEQLPIVDSTTKIINWGASCGGEVYSSTVGAEVVSVMLGEKSAEDAYSAIVAASK